MLAKRHMFCTVEQYEADVKPSGPKRGGAEAIPPHHRLVQMQDCHQPPSFSMDIALLRHVHEHIVFRECGDEMWTAQARDEWGRQLEIRFPATRRIDVGRYP